MKPVKVGVIGIGNMGWHHARVLSLLRDAELIGVADPDEARGRLASTQFNCRWYADYSSLINEGGEAALGAEALQLHSLYRLTEVAAAHG